MSAAAGLRIWARERFPSSQAVMFAVLYLAIAAGAHALAGDGPVPLGPADLLAIVALTAFFLMLRIFDELKDYEADAAAHPDRPLQRGVIRRDQLRPVLVGAVLTQVIVTSAAGGLVALGWWAAAALWSLLMLREFFIGRWLRPRLMWYAALHLLVMPLAMLWIGALAMRGGPLPATSWWLAALGLAAGAGFEVARKLRVPADEHPSAPTYTQHLGIDGAVMLLVAIVQIGALVAGGTLAAAAALPAVAIVALALPLAAASGYALAFARYPTRGRARAAGGAATAAMLVDLLVVIGAILITRGTRWG